MFYCETWEIFKSTFLTEHFRWLLLKLLFLFYVKIYLLIEKKRRQKLIDKVVDKPGTVFF